MTWLLKKHENGMGGGSAREAPNSKLQKARCLIFETLELLWCLEVGAWCFLLRGVHIRVAPIPFIIYIFPLVNL